IVSLPAASFPLRIRSELAESETADLTGSNSLEKVTRRSAILASISLKDTLSATSNIPLRAGRSGVTKNNRSRYALFSHTKLQDLLKTNKSSPGFLRVVSCDFVDRLFASRRTIHEITRNKPKENPAEDFLVSYTDCCYTAKNPENV